MTRITQGAPRGLDRNGLVGNICRHTLAMSTHRIPFAMKRSPTGRPFPRLGMTWLAGVVLVAQLASTAHLAVVRHALCLEHGEYVHAEASTGEAVRVPVHSLAPGLTDGTAALSSEEAHDHCGVLAHRRDPQLAAGPAAQVAVEVRETPSVPGTERAPLTTAELFRLVPKQSPPV